MTNPTEYAINLDARFGPLEVADVPAVVAACRAPWFNQTLCRVNDCVVRLGVLRGAFHWHKHAAEDEYFHVLEGRLLIDLEPQGEVTGATARPEVAPGRTIALEAQQGFLVPRGVVHRTRAPQRVVVLMIEGAGVKPTGD